MNTLAEAELNTAERERYSRHLLLPEVGEAGQMKLKRGKVLIVGMGGLGSPAALYLAAAGVGRIGLVDFDVVDASNLQRQVIYGEHDVGASKTSAAASRLRDINPQIDIIEHAERFSAANGLALVREYGLVLDGGDNFPTRYLVNDACVLAGLPNVHGSIYRFEGQATVFGFGGGPCYRCLYPEAPPEGMVPSCAAGGVLGVLPGIIGMIQATEALKILLGTGETLSGRLLLYDALGMRFQELPVAKDPACPACGERATIKELKEISQACAAPAADEITAEALAARMSGRPMAILDVREDHEVAAGRIPGSTHVRLGDLAARAGELDKGKEWVVYCKGGGRSRKAVDWMKGAGFDKALNLKGGITGWKGKIEVP